MGRKAGYNHSDETKNKISKSMQQPFKKIKTERIRNRAKVVVMNVGFFNVNDVGLKTWIV